MRRTARPVEERRLTVWFFAASLGLVIVTGWTIYDEMETRRPWKQYQREFWRREREAVEKELLAAEEALARPPLKDKLSRLEADLETARQRRDSLEGRTAQAELDAAQKRYDELQQKLNFLRSERDEAFYQWKKRVHEGRSSSPWEEKYEKLSRLVADKEKELAAALAAREEAEKKWNAYLEPVESFSRQKEKLTASRGKLKARLDLLATRRPVIDQIILPALHTVDRCPTCHLAIERPGFDSPDWPHPFRTHPQLDLLLGKVHPVRKFGCTACHHGIGPQIKGIGRRPFDHGRSDPYWERPLLQKPFVESTCSRCHDEEWHIPGAPLWNKGKQLFSDFGCYSCHLTAGFEKSRRIGPSLRRLAVKIRPEWLEPWLAAPRSLSPRTRMPHTWLEDDGLPPEERAEEIKAVAAYLWNASETGELMPLAELSSANAERGKKLFVERGCVGCHRLASLALPPLSSPELLRDYGPDLDGIGRKVPAEWLAAFLPAPAAWFPETRMPTTTLTAAEIADLALFLNGETAGGPFPAPGWLNQPHLISRGETLISLYGCYSCHEIRGVEDSLKIGPELNGFGEKTPDLLSFGDTVLNPKERTWERWTLIKLTHPRAFRTEREKLVMTDNGLTAGEAEALMVYLKSLRTETISREYQRPLSEVGKGSESGERLMKEYNCRGCHVENGQGGEVRKLFSDPGLYPPDLTGEGAKVQPAWLFQFLKKPSVLRPWLTMQMPVFNFSDADAEALVYYFLVQARQRELLLAVPTEMNTALYQETVAVFDQLKCLSCHQLTLGPAQKLSDLAPDMVLTRSRLRPAWVEQFILDPQTLMPGTKMPSFFPREDDEDPESMITPFPHWLKGDPRAQIRALTEYLYVMESNNPVAVSGPQTPGP